MSRKTPALAPAKTFLTADGQQTPIHYFASSAAEWRTGADLGDLIAQMRKAGYAFNVYLVRLPETAGYKIEYYRPVVPEGKLVWIGAYT